MAKTPQRFRASLKKLFPKAMPKRIVVACSGGVDSMALLELSRNFINSKDLDDSSLEVCYVDHRQRKDTAIEKKILKTYCTRHKLRLHCRELSGIRADASEADLREARYEALKEVAKEAWVFTAHHADDDLETFLFKFLRGAHPDTIRGIPERSRRGTLYLARPLLGFSKKELLEYAKTQKLEWNEDITNLDKRYARNRIRHELIPLLEELRPKSSQHLLEFFQALGKKNAELNHTERRVLQTALLSKTGIGTLSVNFDQIKGAIDLILGQASARTSKSQWESFKKLLAQRQATRSGGGETKTVQFPGGHSLCFKGTRLFWLENPESKKSS